MMLKTGSALFVRESSESGERILHPATVVEVGEAGCAVTLPEGEPPLAAGQEIVVFYEIRREFHQQVARVVASVDEAAEEAGGEASPEAPLARVTLEATGDPVSAESRQNYRVSAMSADIEADFGDESGCAVRDVSSTGFSLVARQRRAIGSTLAAKLVYRPDDDSEDAESLAGRVCVQSVRDLGTGIRYGVRYVDAAPAVADALNRVSLSIQRAQLRRR